MAAFREETFGPVAFVMPFRDEARALAVANDTPYGLAAYLFTRDLARAWRVAEALESGMVGINTGPMAACITRRMVEHVERFVVVDELHGFEYGRKAVWCRSLDEFEAAMDHLRRRF